MNRRRVDLRENGTPVEVPLDAHVGVALMGLDFVEAHPVPASSLWTLTPRSKVGSVSVGDLEVHVAPKVPVHRLLWLLQHSNGVPWRDEQVQAGHVDDLATAVADVYERLLRHATRGGLRQGYRTVEDSLTVIRGRIREPEQLRRRFGLPLPVEVRYDDYIVDTPENRLLRAALEACLQMPALPRELRTRLTRQRAQFTDVTPVRPAALEPWTPSRLNIELRDALHFAEIVLASTSFDPDGTGLTTTGFVVNMAKVFEDFVCTALATRLAAKSGNAKPQARFHLDLARQVVIRPDLVWFTQQGSPAAVIDAKYKAEKPSGFPDADLYQMLAYCTRLRLPVGHLVYAKGNETPSEHRIDGADITILAHALDLSLPPTRLEVRMDQLAAAIESGASALPRAVGEMS